MGYEKIELKTGEIKSVSLPNRGSRGLMLVYHIEDSTVIDISRKEIKSQEEISSLKLKPGDTVPAIFLIKGKKAGVTSIHFSEKRAGMPESPELEVKTITVVVSE
jgi:uncharacterized membrane protein